MDVVRMGVFLKQQRTQMKLTQNEVAQQIGISPQAISKWERGENLPDVTYFPDIAKIYNIRIETLISAGASPAPDEEEPFNFNDLSIPLFDTGVFENIIKNLETSDTIARLQMPLDFFPYLGTVQKSTFITAFLQKPDYALFLDELLPYVTTSNKSQILGFVLDDENYSLLESLILFLNNEMKQVVLNKLLHTASYDLIEDFLPFFNKRHRSSIIDFFIAENIEKLIIENFLPFFDNGQAQRLQTIL